MSLSSFSIDQGIFEISITSPELNSDNSIMINPANRIINLQSNTELKQNVDEFYNSRVFLASYTAQTEKDTPVLVFQDKIERFKTNYSYQFYVNFVTPDADSSCILTCNISVLAIAEGNVLISDPSNLIHNVINDLALQDTRVFMEYDKGSNALSFFVQGVSAYGTLFCGISHSVNAMTVKG